MFIYRCMYLLPFLHYMSYRELSLCQFFLFSTWAFVWWDHYCWRTHHAWKHKVQRTTASMGKEKESEDQDFI